MLKIIRWIFNLGSVKYILKSKISSKDHLYADEKHKLWCEFWNLPFPSLNEKEVRSTTALKKKKGGGTKF